ncbi:TetR/AcrR family transcriptional regulator [Planctomonas psychrotolerans]|uniref:TetR/AcrR family transcriptional regulator n=1 Tax=Planctomonas psychrotolerans TaxID=2528712 RepID=UPI00123881C6|nr:TetR/AcrR family transcriptional regulator [Planctomonas psychrotolerans]
MTNPTPRKRGPRTTGDARESIVIAARALFMEYGVERVSARRIASTADVDPSLVRYYFNSTEALLEEALKIPEDLSAAFNGIGDVPIEERGAAFLSACLDLWEHPMGITIMHWLTFASERDSVAYRHLIGMMTEGIRLALPDSVSADELAMRTGLINSVTVGLGIARYVWKFEPLASLSREQILASHGPAVQRYLAEPLPF